MIVAQVFVRTIKTQLIEVVSRSKFAIWKARKRGELRSSISCLHFGRRCPNLGKEASTIENNYCTIEHNYLYPIDIINFNCLRPFSLRNSQWERGEERVLRTTSLYLEMGANPNGNDITTIQFSTIAAQLILNVSVSRIAAEGQRLPSPAYHIWEWEST